MTKRDQHTNDPALGHADHDDDRDDAGVGDADDHGDDIYIMMQFCLSRKMITFLKGLSVCLFVCNGLSSLP